MKVEEAAIGAADDHRVTEDIRAESECMTDVAVNMMEMKDAQRSTDTVELVEKKDIIRDHHYVV